jgi:hypothetical protein
MLRTAVCAFSAVAIGAAGLTIMATPAMASCDVNYMCFYTKVGQQGPQYDAYAPGYTTDKFYLLTTWYPSSTLLGSVWNRWSNRIYVSSGTPGNTNLCYPPNGKGSPDEILYYVYFANNPTC